MTPVGTDGPRAGAVRVSGARAGRSVRRRLSPLAVVFLTVFIDLVGFGIVIPLVPLYAESYHPSPAAFGILMASFSAMQFLFAPLLGRLSDRVGRRPVLLVSLLGSFLSYLLFAFSSSFALLLASRVLAGVMGANIGTAQAVIADVTPQGDRARGMGLVGMAFGLGFVFGPAIGGFAVKASPALPGLVAAGLSLCAFVWAFFGLPETRPASTAARPPRHWFPLRAVVHAFARPVLGPLLLVTLLNTTAFSNFEATFAQFARSRFGHDPSTVSWLFVLIGVTAAVVQGGLIRRLVPLLGEARLVGIGTTLLALSFTGLVLVPGHAGLVGLVVTTAAGSGLTNPALSGLLSRSTDASEQGEILGAAQSLSSLGRILGPFWGEHAWFAWGAAGPYGTGALLEVLAVVVVLVGLRTVAAPVRVTS